LQNALVEKYYWISEKTIGTNSAQYSNGEFFNYFQSVFHEFSNIFP